MRSRLDTTRPEQGSQDAAELEKGTSFGPHTRQVIRREIAAVFFWWNGEIRSTRRRSSKLCLRNLPTSERPVRSYTSRRAGRGVTFQRPSAAGSTPDLTARENRRVRPHHIIARSSRPGRRRRRLGRITKHDRSPRATAAKKDRSSRKLQRVDALIITTPDWSATAARRVR